MQQRLYKVFIWLNSEKLAVVIAEYQTAIVKHGDNILCPFLALAHHRAVLPEYLHGRAIFMIAAKKEKAV